MAITILSQASSLNPGADLWIIPDETSSKFSQKIDWYMNFQFLKNQLHTKRSINNELRFILNECELSPITSAEAKHPGLLVSSSELLPNRWILQIPYSQNTESWCQFIIQIWQGLKQPTLRIFLPTGLSTGDFQRIWGQIQSFNDFSIVVD
jgi:hypothetical protein